MNTSVGKPLSIAVLVSGSGRTLQNFIDLAATNQLPVKITAVIASRPGLGGLQRAANAAIPNFIVDRRQNPDLELFSRQIFQLCDDSGAELVCLAGWLSLLKLPLRYSGRVMNIHPALLPSFGGKGMYGHHVHEAVLAHGCKVSGCTVHFVDNEYDAGPIILQNTCPVLDDDTPDTLADRVFQQELLAYPQAIRLFQQGRLRIDGRRVQTAPLP